MMVMGPGPDTRGNTRVQTEPRLVIPAPEEITAEWLTEALSHHADWSGVEITEVRPEPLAKGVGMMSDLARLHISHTGDHGLPRTVIAKGSAKDLTNRQVAEAFDLYAREVAFFREVAELTTARTPRCWYLDINDDHDSIILMEDLQRHVPGDQEVGCTADQARACARELARLHGALWNQVDHPRFDAVPLHRSVTHGDIYLRMLPDAWDRVLDIFGDAVPDRLAAAKDEFCAALVPLQEWITAEPRTIVHGDFRMGNLLFCDEAGEPPVVIVDWQGDLRAKGIQDLAYLLSQSVETELRRLHERSLVEVYCQELAAVGVDYAVEQAWADYQKACCYLWTYAVMIAGTLDMVNDAGVRWMRKMVERSSAAFMDFDGFRYL